MFFLKGFLKVAFYMSVKLYFFFMKICSIKPSPQPPGQQYPVIGQPNVSRLFRSLTGGRRIQEGAYIVCTYRRKNVFEHSVQSELILLNFCRTMFYMFIQFVHDLDSCKTKGRFLAALFIPKYTYKQRIDILSLKNNKYNVQKVSNNLL